LVKHEVLQHSRKTASVPEVPSVSSGTTRAVKIQWEYDLVEKPFCEQLKAMGGSGWKAALMCPN
jgi:hypothetical protein